MRLAVSPELLPWSRPTVGAYVEPDRGTWKIQKDSERPAGGFSRGGMSAGCGVRVSPGQGQEGAGALPPAVRCAKPVQEIVPQKEREN